MSKECCVCNTTTWWMRPDKVCNCTVAMCVSCWMTERLSVQSNCTICKSTVSLPFRWWYAVPWIQRLSFFFYCRAFPLLFQGQMSQSTHSVFFGIHMILLILLSHPYSFPIRLMLLVFQTACESVLWMRGSHFNVLSSVVSLTLLYQWDWWLLASRITGWIVDSLTVWLFYLQLH